MAISVTTSYATVSEASAYLIGNTVWATASFQDKTDALLEARYYIDATYSCSFDQSAPPDEVKYASSLLASDFIVTGDLFFANESTIKKKSVKAGSVQSSKEYSATSKQKPASIGKVNAVMASLGCTNTGTTVFLQRA